ncbi:MAG: hypothetical protein ACOYIH_08935 [Candidatus Fimadaptatus sp.]|jgi:hypothetical protein
MKRDWDKAFAETPELFHRKLEDTLHEIEEGRCVKKRYKVGTLVLAALLVLALAGGIAVAASRGVFGQLGDELTGDQYALLDGVASSIGQTAATSDGRISVELSQSYYTGDELFVGLTYALDAFNDTWLDADFKPDEELIEKIKENGPYWNDEFQAAAMMRLASDGNISNMLETFEAIDALNSVEPDGDEFACVARRSVEISSDQILTFNGEDHMTGSSSGMKTNTDDMYLYTIEYSQMPGCEEDGLPEVPDDVTQVQYSIFVEYYDQYYYKDATGIYKYMELHGEPERLTFTIPRAPAIQRTGSVEVEFPGYKVKAEAIATPVSTRVRINVDLDAKTYARWNDENEDFVESYCLIKNGEEYMGGSSSYIYIPNEDGTGTYKFEMSTTGVDMEADSVLMRPYFSMSGADSSGDIVIPIK